MKSAVLLRRRVAAGVIGALACGAAALAPREAGQATRDVATLDVSRPGPQISATMFGVFFEDINFAADGGLYPELVKNRSFEFTEPLYAWRRVWREGADGELTIRSDAPLNAQNTHYLRLRVYTTDGVYGLVNSGFRGMGVHSGAEYVLSAYVRANAGAPQTLSMRLTDEKDQPLAEATLTGFTNQWKRYETTLRPSATNPRAQLEITAKGEGEIDIDMVSLYPKETWKNRPNGLRKDLVTLLADMKPGFIRFPGVASSRGAAWSFATTGRRLLATSPSGRHWSIGGTTSSAIDRRRTISSPSDSGSSNTSSLPRTSARRRCRSSTAAWPASSIRVNWPT
jgi:Carbohydrate binding domain